jgi:hypothetical protein
MAYHRARAPKVCSRGRTALLALLASLSAAIANYARADDALSVTDAAPARPVIEFNRWKEDWSVLANPDVPAESLDSLKYIPLSSTDPQTYLSLGANVRERFESNDAVSFGTTGNREENYVISRLEADADMRIAEQIQIFTQLQSDFAPGKEVRTPVDQDRLSLEQAFIAVTESLGGGILKVRVGRQQFAFDLQRFVSVRDGPNVRQSYDAVWADYEIGRWRLISFYSHPVQNRDEHPFDDYSSGHLTYGGFRAERKLTSFMALAVSYSQFTQDKVTFATTTGNERREILDMHLSGALQGFDWDVEGMNQIGRLGDKVIRAWAYGSLGGYTFNQLRWTPRVGLQIDAASGNKNPNGGQINTFNPLFPNGYYVTLAGYTGYVNFVHVKPSVTVHPREGVRVMLAVGAQWRESTADAVYTQPDIPVASTAGHPGNYTGTYEQFRTDWTLSPHTSVALELVHFAIGDVLRAAGGHDSNYAGAEFRFAW